MDILKTLTSIILIVMGIAISTNSFGQKIPVTTNSLIALAHYERGMDFRNQHLFAEAAKAYKKAILADSTFAIAHAKFAVLAGKINIAKPERIKYYEKAIKLAVNASTGEQQLISIISAYKIDEKALIEETIKLLQEFPDDISALQFLGNQYYFRLKNYRAAELTWKKGIKRHPNISRFYNNVGYTLRAQKKYQEAEAVYQEAINKFPWELNVYDSLADLYVEMKEYEKAIELYKVCISIDPISSNSKTDMENVQKLMSH